MRRYLYLFTIIIVAFCTSFAQAAIDHWESVVKADGNWRFISGTSEPASNWIELNFDESAWSEGNGGFGYGDNDDGTIISPVSSVYLRAKFTLINLAQIEKAVLLADFDDAFVAYLNGKEIARSGISSSRPTFNQFADSEHEAMLYQGLYPSEYIISKTDFDNLVVEGENVLAVQVHNINATSSDLSSNFYLHVAIDNPSISYEPVPSWFRDPLDFETSNLPIIKIDTDGRYIPDEPKINARMGIIDNGPGNMNHINDPFNDYDGNIGIEVRGSSSQMFPKKQYAVELWTSAGIDTVASLLGMPEEEDWILYAPYSDKSLIRNVLTYKLASDMGNYAPRTRLCELYINNEYLGVYVLTEKIKRDKNRVDISKLTPDENSGDELTGGYIVKIDKFDGATEGLGWDSPHFPPYRSKDQVVHFQFHYPKEDEITSVQSNYIKGAITDFEDALKSPDFLHPREGYKKHIDVASFIDFAIINEISHNVDAYRLSTYLYKDKDSNDERIYIGPVWDYNLAFGNADYCAGGKSVGWAWDFNSICRYDYWLVPFWWKRFLRDPEYLVQLQARWSSLRNDTYSTESIMNYIDSVALVLEHPQQRNFKKWPILDQWIWPNNYIGGTYAKEVTFLKNWINHRLSWLDTNIAALEIITGLEDLALLSERKISVYPNPNDGTFNVKFHYGTHSEVTLVLHNQLGEVINNKILIINDLNELNLSYNINGNALETGLYFVKITDGSGHIFTEKIIVQ